MKKIINTLLVAIFSLFVSQAVYAIEFEFGQLTVENCIDSECSIDFVKKGKYQSTPLVFLMPTFNDGNWRDAPSILRLTEVTPNGAKFRQYIAPINTKNNRIVLKEKGQCGNQSYCMEKVPMTKINYFVIEEGEINLGSKGRIYAGSINANKYIQGAQKIKESGKNKNIDQLAHTINFPQGFTSPGIITEIQASSKNVNWGHPNNWLTPVVQKKDRKFYLSLDRSEVIIHNDFRSNQAYKGARKVGYLIVEGSGVYRGLEFSLGGDTTPNTLDNKIKGFDNITEPVRRQCKALFDIKDSYRFNEFPFILASKNSRNGSDGGFLRLCQQVDNGLKKKVSFVNDEDLNEPRRGKGNETCGGQTCLERRHADENIGFIAFQQKVDADVCEMFPGPAQTWFGNNSKGNHLYLATYGGNKENYPQILNAAKIKGKRYVGFIPGKVSDDGRAGCNGVECKGDPNLRLSESPVLPDFPKPDHPRPIPDIIDGTTVVLSSSANIGALTIQNGGQLTLRSGTYFINSISLNNGGKIVVPAGNKVKLHTKWLSMSQAGSEIKALNNTEDLVIYIHANTTDKPHGTFDYIALDQYSKIRGLLYSEKIVDLSNGAEVTGAVTAVKLRMHNQTKITGESICIETQPEFKVTLSPAEAQPLLCKAQKVDFQFAAVDGGSGQYNGVLHLNLSGERNKSVKGSWAKQPTGPWESFEGRTPSFSLPVNGKGTSLWFKSDKLGVLNIEAIIEDMVGEAARGSYNFIPGGLEITPDVVNLVAGKPASLTMKVLACDDDDDSSEALTEYHGNKVFDFKTLNVYPSADTASDYKIELKDTGQGLSSKKWQDKKGTFYFNRGVASGVPVRYMDAGQLKLELACSGKNCGFGDDGDDDDTRAKAQLKAETTIKSRPYTFALCNSGESEVEKATGTSEGGERFLAAGDTFDVVAKPVIWLDSDGSKYIDGNQNANAPVDSSVMCSRQVTTNYYQGTAPESTVLLSHELVTPTQKDGGVKGCLTGTLSQRNSQLKSAPFKAGWSEVGSLRLQAGTTEKYLGMDVNMGYRSVGRFYPKYLQLTADSFTYPAGQTGFAYMDQNFIFGFTVEAQNAAEAPTKNYGLFADPLKASLELMVVDSTKAETKVNTLAGRVEYFSRKGRPYTWLWSGAAWNKGGKEQPKTAEMSISEPNFTFVRNYYKGTNRASATRYSAEDGPFDADNTRMGLFIKTQPDPLEWNYITHDGEQKLKQVETTKTYIGQVWSSKPDIRYGRMVMDDAAAATGQTVSVPLRVEYWDDVLGFVVNGQDSAAVFDGSKYCKQQLTTSDPKVTSNSHLSSGGEKTVDNGDTASGALSAVPHYNGAKPLAQFSEQVRFWQKIVSQESEKGQNITCQFGTAGSSEQPWLLYDWRDLGDENPSAVVTFGVYRGNDRIIYRGEKGMNHHLN